MSTNLKFRFSSFTNYSLGRYSKTFGFIGLKFHEIVFQVTSLLNSSLKPKKAKKKPKSDKKDEDICAQKNCGFVENKRYADTHSVDMKEPMSFDNRDGVKVVQGN